MNSKSIAPCGVICDLCYGYQRNKNRCVGCASEGYKPYHCTSCSIKSCPEKHGNELELCIECSRFPCRRIRDLDKRYVNKYGESPAGNLRRIKENGIRAFISESKEYWKCGNCGALLCAHRETCLSCGAVNPRFPSGDQQE